MRHRADEHTEGCPWRTRLAHVSDELTAKCDVRGTHKAVKDSVLQPRARQRAAEAQLDNEMRAPQQAAQRRVARAQARVHSQAAKGLVDVDGRKARPARDARRQLARRQHRRGDVQRQRLAELARAREKGARAAVHARFVNKQVRYGARLVHEGIATRAPLQKARTIQGDRRQRAYAAHQGSYGQARDAGAQG